MIYEVYNVLTTESANLLCKPIPTGLYDNLDKGHMKISINKSPIVFTYRQILII